MRLYRQTVQDHGLYTGLELEDEQLQKLRQDAGAMSAKMRAVRIVTVTNVSKSDLQRRLVQKGEDPTQAKEAVEWMQSLSLVDDAKTAEQIVSSCVRKGYGLARATQALFEKRIPKSYWDEALSEYPDQTDHILTFLRSRITDPEDEKQIRKATDALIRRGHSYGQIRQALRQLQVDDEFLEE